MSLVSPSPPLRELTSRQWQWIGAGFMMTFASMGGQTLFIAQFNSDIRAYFELSHGQFAGLYTIATIFSAVLIAAVGQVTDKFGPRLLAMICTIGLALMAFGMSMVNHWIFLCLILFGLRFFGQGMLPHIAQTAVARWFNRFRGRALAFSQMGYTAGEALLPFIITTALISMSWRNVWALGAGFLIVIMLPLIFFLLRDPPDGKRAKARGDINPDASEGNALTGGQWTRGKVLKDPLFYALVFGAMTLPGLITLYFFHQAHLVDVKGWSVTTYTAWFPIMSVTGVSVSILTGFLVDRFSAYRLLPFMYLPVGIACLIMANLNAEWAIPLFLLVLAMGSGMAPAVFGALWAEMYGTTHIGAVRSLAIAVMVFASAAGPGIAGGFIDLGINLEVQSWVYAAYCLAISVLYLVLQPKLVARFKKITAG
ncbi:MFS transporter [Maritalea sp.]|uniref:MFS transporter n=1 Tax=Maritalea sp. TaxID=2003361 RepID=UPI003F4AB036